MVKRISRQKLVRRKENVMKGLPLEESDEPDLDRLRLYAKSHGGGSTSTIVQVLRWLALRHHRKQESLRMERRHFLNLAAAATATMALEPSTFAAITDTKNPVHYPDPAIEIVDPRFAKYVVGNAAIE